MTESDFVARLEPLKARLYRTALLYLGGEAAALDAVDEAVYRGLTGYRKLREPDFFDTWMTRILINVCNDELRRRKKEHPVEVFPETAQEAFDSLPLRCAVEALPPPLRAVIVLRFFAGYTLAETARALNLPPGTISTRQRKALALLRLELSDSEEV